MLLNYLDYSKFLVILVIMLMTLIVCIISYFKLSLTSEKFPLKASENSPSPHISLIIKENNHNLKLKRENKKVKIQGFQQNEISEAQKKFNLGEITDNVDHLTQKLTNKKNNILEKKDEISIMFLESLSSLNSWKNNEVEGEIFKELHWNLERCQREYEEESLVYQYIFPSYNDSNYSANVNIDSEDEEELLCSYKLGICRTFEKDENNIKTNIVKEVHGNLFKIYSEGNPNLIKEKYYWISWKKNENELFAKPKN